MNARIGPSCVGEVVESARLRGAPCGRARSSTACSGRCALAQHAIRKGFRALYRPVSRLLDELALARADGSYVRALARFARADVLVLDDWGMTPLSAESRRDLNEVLEDSWGEKSTIVFRSAPHAR